MSGPAGAWAGPGAGDGGGVVVMAYFRCFGGGGTMQGCTAKGAGRRRGPQVPRHRLETMIAAPLLHGPARKWIDLLCALWWAFRPVSRKTAAAAGITRWARN